MAQERLESLIRQWRQAYGDEYISGSASKITNYLTEDGEVFTAQTAKDFAVQSVNKFIQTLQQSLKGQRGGMDILAKELYEYVTRKEYPLGTPDNDGTYGVKCQLPSDFGWLLGVRYQFLVVGGGFTGWYVPDLEGTFKGYEEIRGHRNAERVNKNGAYVEGEYLLVFDGSGSAWPSTAVDMTYLAKQPEILAGDTTTDIRLKRFDYEIVQLMKLQAEFFQGQRVG